MQLNTQEFNELIYAKFGETQLLNVLDIQRTIVYRHRQGLVHLEAIKDQIEKFADFRASNLVPSSLTREFEKFVLNIDLHLNPLVQILGSLVSSSAFYVYLTLGLNLIQNPLFERDFSIFKIIRAFESFSEFGDLRVLLKNLHSGGHHQYICALNTHSKHRILLKVTSNIAANIPFCRNDIFFSAFMCGDINYPEVRAIDVVEYEYFRCVSLLNEIDNSLIDTLNSM